MEEAKKEVEKIINETVEDKKHIIIRLLVYIRSWFRDLEIFGGNGRGTLSSSPRRIHPVQSSSRIDPILGPIHSYVNLPAKRNKEYYFLILLLRSPPLA